MILNVFNQLKWSLNPTNFLKKEEVFAEAVADTLAVAIVVVEVGEAVAAAIVAEADIEADNLGEAVLAFEE